MSDSPEVSILIHELGGMLSSVQGFAHIAEANPEHPNRERFIALAASEARRAAQALKDLHLVRALDRGAIPASPPPVALAGLLAEALGETSGSGGDAGEVSVAVDPPKIASLLTRCCATATAPVEVVTAGGRAEVRIPVAPAEELHRRTQAVEAPYPAMVTFSLLRRILRHWGGDVVLGAEGDWTVAVVRLPRA